MLKTAAGVLSVLIAAAAFGLAQPALAGSGADISTPAWSNHDLPLFVGPGDHYAVRAVVPGGTRISVDRCSVLWCHVRAGRHAGYAFQYSLSFGQGPNSVWWPAEARHPGVQYRFYHRNEPSF